MRQNTTSHLSKLIKTKQAKVGIVGMGYVGTALSEACYKGGFSILGIDIDSEKVAIISSLGKKNFQATENIKRLEECDVIAICVPTPVDEYNRPNFSILTKAASGIAANLKKGQLVILESSVAPQTTRNLLYPILASGSQLKGSDFFLAFSPERVDPGNGKFNVTNTPKVVSGIDEASLKLATLFYSSFVEKVYPVSSLEAAEMTKVLENVFRLVNISLINEINQFTKSIGIDIWEVIGAASTKPFGFLAHYPGPGAGGDCIPVLPYHLLDAAAKTKVNLKVVEAAAAVNEAQPQKVAQKAVEVINGKFVKNGHNPNVLLVGVSYKEETADIRQSPALKIWKELEKSGMNVSYHDPYVQNINGYTSKKLTSKTVREHDLIIITTAHKKIPYRTLVRSKKPLIDTKNTLSKYRQPHIIRL